MGVCDGGSLRDYAHSGSREAGARSPRAGRIDAVGRFLWQRWIAGAHYRGDCVVLGDQGDIDEDFLVHVYDSDVHRDAPNYVGRAHYAYNVGVAVPDNYGGHNDHDGGAAFVCRSRASPASTDRLTR